MRGSWLAARLSEALALLSRRTTLDSLSPLDSTRAFRQRFSSAAVSRATGLASRVRHATRQMKADMRSVLLVAAARLEVGLVVLDRLGPGRRSPARRTARQRTGLLAGLPEVEHVLAVRDLFVVGGANALRPLATFAVCRFKHPGAGAFGLAITEPEARGDVCETIRRAAAFQLFTVGASGNLGGGAKAARHGLCPVGVPMTGLNRARLCGDNNRLCIEQTRAW